MSDIKFACPACQQHISADQGYAGMEIACPACNARMIVPGAPVRAPVPVPVPVPSSAYAPVPASAPYAPPPPPAAGGGCPSCGAALPRGTVLCTNCGYNFATKQRVVAGRVVAPGKPMPQSDGEEPWYKTPYPYLLVVVVIFGVLAFLGKQNPGMMLALLGLALMFSLSVHIWAVVSAFRTSVGTGFLTLCVPFYGIYFVFSVNDSLWLKAFYSVAILINICLRVVSHLL